MICLFLDFSVIRPVLRGGSIPGLHPTSCVIGCFLCLSFQTMLLFYSCTRISCGGRGLSCYNCVRCKLNTSILRIRRKRTFSALNKFYDYFCEGLSLLRRHNGFNYCHAFVRAFCIKGDRKVHGK